MKSTSINRRLSGGLIAIIVFFLLQAAAVLTLGRQTEREVVDIARRNTTAQVDLAELSTLAQQIRRYEKEYFIYVEVPSKRAQYQKEWTGTMDQIKALLGKMRSNADGAFSSDDSRNMGKWAAAADFYNSEMTKIFVEVEARAQQVASEQEKAMAEAASRPSKTRDTPPPAPQTRMPTPSEANDMIKSGKDRFSADLIKGVTQTFAAKSAATLALTAVTNEGFNTLIYSVIATVLVGVAIGLYLLFTLPPSVTRPIEQLTKSVDAISRGDTSKSSATASVREFAGLSSAIERMRVAQEMMVQRLRKSS